MLLIVSFADGTTLSLRTDSANMTQAPAPEARPRGIPDSEWNPDALRPRCVHGRLFTDPCEPCESADLSDPTPPSGTQQPAFPQVADANTDSDPITLLP